MIGLIDRKKIKKNITKINFLTSAWILMNEKMFLNKAFQWITVGSKLKRKQKSTYI